jgi:serine/threonine-protein kinase
MAPEQIEGGDVSARSDVFGLGVLLYECMVGKLPFDGKNPAQVLRRVLEGAFTPAERARPTIGTGLGAIVDRALAKDAKDRFASTLDVAEALRAELRLLGFDDPASEIGAFLADTKQYRVDFEARVVDALVRRGRQAREQRDVPTATTSFNRALAFRPGRHGSDHGSLGAGPQSALSPRFDARPGDLDRQSDHRGRAGRSLQAGGQAAWPESQKAGRLRGLVRKSSGSRPRAALGQPDGSAEPAQPTRKKPRRKPPAEVPKEVVSEATASVQVAVKGPQNASVFLDGQPFNNWFGTAHDLSVGEHTFEFRRRIPNAARGR